MIDTFLKRLIVTLSVTLVFVLPLITPIADEWLISHFMNQLDEHPLSYREWLMQTAPGPRLIIDSGSNARIGINCEMLADTFEATPLMLAFAAPDPLMPKLRRIVKYAQPGDVIVLPLEWSNLDWSLYSRTSDVVTDWFPMMLSYDYFMLVDQLRYFSADERHHLPSQIALQPQQRTTLLTFSNKNAPSWAQREAIFKAFWDGTELPEPTAQTAGLLQEFQPQPYRMSNRYGNSVTPAAVPPDRANPFTFYLFTNNDELGQPFLTFLSELSIFAQDHPEITILFTYPSTSQEQAWLDDPVYLANRATFLDRLLPVLADHGFTMIGNVEDSSFNWDAFADSGYHLTPPYRDLRTERLIEHLKPYLKERTHVI